MTSSASSRLSRPPRPKVTYDLPPAIQTAVREISMQLGCSQSDVAAHLLAFGLQSCRDGRLDLHSQRQAQIFALRFSHKLCPLSLPTEPPTVEPAATPTF